MMGQDEPYPAGESGRNAPKRLSHLSIAVAMPVGSICVAATAFPDFDSAAR